MIHEPRFVLSKKMLFEQYKKLESMGLVVSYSVKTNHHVSRLLEEGTSCFFSVHTKEELEFVQDKKRAWFLAESWTPGQIALLVDKGVERFVVYNSRDLDMLLGYLESNPVQVDLLLRVKLRENTIFTGKYFIFGMDSKVLNRKIHELRGNKNIRKLGVHFHRKTQNIAEWALKHEVEGMLEEKTLNEIDILNIGGGLPVKYKNTSDDVLDHIISSISELKSWIESYDITLMIEPGRFLAGPPVALEASIINVSENTITVNCSVYNTAMDTLIIPLKLLIEGEAESGRSYVVKGCTPCSLDIFRYSVSLPEKSVGDTLKFLNAGAYAFHTGFCSLQKVKTVIVD